MGAIVGDDAITLHVARPIRNGLAAATHVRLSGLWRLFGGRG